MNCDTSIDELPTRGSTRRTFLGRSADRHRQRWPWRRCSTRACCWPPRSDGRRDARALAAAWSIRCTSPPKAKRIIYLYMAGGPSHLETFDYKPKLAEMHGQPMPESFTKGQPIAQLQGQKLDLLRAAASVPEVRQVAARRSATIFPHLGHDRRRHLHHPLDAHRGDQPRPGPHLHEHRHDDLRPAGDGLVAARTAWAARATTCPASSS